MPPSTFASAAAGNSANPTPTRAPAISANPTPTRAPGNSANSPPTRAESGSEWPRRSNGHTQTFRRPSFPPGSDHKREPSATAPLALYVPPHRNGALPELCYSRNQLLHLFGAQQGSEAGLRDGLPSLYMPGWEPNISNGSTSASWGRTEHARDHQPGPEICWERDGGVLPVGLTDLDDEEKELFSTSVNTPLKPPAASKENAQTNGMPRRISVSHSINTPGGYGLPSPNERRGQGRRREPSESYPFPSNPLASPAIAREEGRAASPPPSLQRRRTNLKSEERDQAEASEKPAEGGATPFAPLKRSTTGPFSAALGGPTSPWSNAQQPAGFSPMGTFGNFNLGGTPAASAEKRAGFGSGRAESRFKSAMSKDSSEDVGTPARSVRERASNVSLSRVNEAEAWRAAQEQPIALDETEEFAQPAGSAALAGSSDTAQPDRQPFRRFATPSRSDSRDDFGFAAFGMTSSAHAFGQDQLYQQPPLHRATQGAGLNEPMSPTDTNPYQSPGQHGLQDEDVETDGSDIRDAHLPGLGPFAGQEHGLGPLPNLGRAPGAAGSDRSQTSSTGPARGFPALGGLGGLSGSAVWPVAQGGIGTPGRQTAGLSSAFGGGIFSSIAELQSPSLAGLGPLGGQFGGGVVGGGSRLASMVPQGMQEQLREEQYGDAGGPGGDTIRNTESPFNVAGLDDVLGAQADMGRADEQSAQFGAPTQQPHAQRQPPSSASNHAPGPPQAQQRTMVMPDRMRWIYRDPQGQTQGPWSGLEMHDWYKAGFFSPELLVKKSDDADYEPLAQLIRRIGNSREPFLVPQIGIPHAAAAPTSQQQQQQAPPFASSFPSFGTTLTAQQQNALEHRKQEEQYLMARQKEHLAQAQIAQRLVAHRASGHSLHEQLSFGSAEAGVFAHEPPAAPPLLPGSVPGFFDNSFSPRGHIREEPVPDRRAQEQNAHAQLVAGALQDRARLAHEQAQFDALLPPPEPPLGGNDRLRQFQELQGAGELDARFQAALGGQQQPPASAGQSSSIASARPGPEPLSLTQQVQQAAASAQQSPLPAVALHSAAAPHPFPPTLSPLPAPAAQRTARHSVADHLHAESRTPALDPTAAAAVAPWATKEHHPDPPKGPTSLKAIQHAEAAAAAKHEGVAAVARKAAAEREMLAHVAAAALAPEPGLPSTSTWAAAAPSPTAALPSVAGAGAWAKAAQKVPAPAAAAGGGGAAKSMALIQREEEARKKRLAAAALAQAAGAGTAPVAGAIGKRYAELAGRGPGAVVGGAWTTVGSGGKVKPASAPPVAVARTGGSGPVAVAKKPPTPAPVTATTPARSSVAAGGAGAVNAQEEFRRWAVGELRLDLTLGISAEDFVATLSLLPPDPDILTEAVHGASHTLDSRHFAEQFLRRKRLADKGLLDASAPGPAAAAAGPSGGWSEVAKKGPAGKEAGSGGEVNFRLAGGRKKGARR